MDFKRIFLLSALFAVGMMLYTEWQQDYGQPPAPVAVAPTPSAPTSLPGLPSASELETSDQVPTALAPPVVTGSEIPQATRLPEVGETLHLVSDVLDLEISLRGGDVVAASLLNYQQSLDDPTLVKLLASDESRFFIARSGLSSPLGPDSQQGRAIYTSDLRDYRLSESEDRISADLVWLSSTGVKVTKRFTLTRGSYAVEVSYQVDNQSNASWNGSFYSQLMRQPPQGGGGMFATQTYEGAVFSTPDDRYNKVNYGELNKEGFRAQTNEGWMAIIEHYFVSAWVVDSEQSLKYQGNVLNDGNYRTQVVGPNLAAAPGQQATTTATLYIGPKLLNQLAEVNDHLELTVDYGWLWFIAKPVFIAMEYIHSWVGNWGWAIILVTLLIKLLFYPLSAASYRSMAKMRTLMPKINALKEKYGSDRQRMSQAMMEMYSKEKVNPLGGCLPMLLQIPVFIALYYVLLESVEFRQAPFMWWITDLSEKDPIYVLPILMGISMFIQQRLSPQPPDPMQAKIMMFLPPVFTLFFLAFPSGLVLYWLVNNILSIAQQWMINRSIEKA